MGEAENKQAIQRAFDAWAAGQGGVFDLLAPDAQWTIVGNSVAAGTYHSREEFLSKVIRPFNARLATPLVPRVHALYAHGDMVIAYFDASATVRDGSPYHNTYTWYLRLREGAIVEAVAFFGSIEFNDFWARVEPAQEASRPSMMLSYRWRNSISIAIFIVAIAFCYVVVTNGIVDLNPILVYLLPWDMFTIVYLSLTTLVFWRANPNYVMRAMERERKPHATNSAFQALYATLGFIVYLVTPGLKTENDWLVLLAGGFAVVAAWLLIHVTYAERYAYEYYRCPKGDEPPTDPLRFPEDEQSSQNRASHDYRDFAYFAFAIGSTFGTTDVDVRTFRVRRIVLRHELISFLFNVGVITTILSLVIPSRS